jgi:hypothetical protein
LVTWVFGPNGADEKACFTEMVQAEMIRWFACLTSFLDTFLFCWGLTYVQRYMYNNKLIHINYIYIYIYIHILYIPLHSFILLDMTFTLYNICQKNGSWISTWSLAPPGMIPIHPQKKSGLKPPDVYI